ncbi:hypothetical protein MRB53_023241 [Persea americana]|uniref:Uncharacterized protein n=1 Tax=Persea americana TaxID=3435 RepID=A0ACC2L9E5_PERAE|nr:hypothetical protein MRB53_023241 [Persea americana]
MGGKDVTSPSVSDIICVTGIITRYIFEFNHEVNSQTKSLRNTSDCSTQTSNLGMEKLEGTCQPFIAPNVEKCKSETSRKKFRKHKVLLSTGMGVMSIDEKGRNTVSHDATNEHGVNQGHRDVSAKVDATPQPPVKSPTIQVSI